MLIVCKIIGKCRYLVYVSTNSVTQMSHKRKQLMLIVGIVAGQCFECCGISIINFILTWIIVCILIKSVVSLIIDIQGFFVGIWLVNYCDMLFLKTSYIVYGFAINKCLIFVLTLTFE